VAGDVQYLFDTNNEGLKRFLDRRGARRVIAMHRDYIWAGDTLDNPGFS